MFRRAVASLALLLALNADIVSATTLDVEGKGWAFEVRGDGALVLMGAWTRELCEKALRDVQTVENPHIRTLGSCFAVTFMDEQIGLEVWMVDAAGDTFILFASRETCEKLTEEVYDGSPDRPACSRVWVRTVV
jgi:hypothetical protein